MPSSRTRPPEKQREVLLKQGRFTPLVAWKLLDEDGNDVPRDGKTAGALWVRGPAVTGSYYRVDGPHPSFKDGWFHTGDVCTIDEYGYLQLVDRSKDLVKSGGEWISSVDLENLIMGHPAIKEAAVIGLAHPKWVERPVAVAVLREGQERRRSVAASLDRRARRQVDDPRSRDLRRRDPAHRRWQIPQARLARTL